MLKFLLQYWSILTVQFFEQTGDCSCLQAILQSQGQKQCWLLRVQEPWRDSITAFNLCHGFWHHHHSKHPWRNNDHTFRMFHLQPKKKDIKKTQTSITLSILICSTSLSFRLLALYWVFRFFLMRIIVSSSNQICFFFVAFRFFSSQFFSVLQINLGQNVQF